MTFLRLRDFYRLALGAYPPGRHIIIGDLKPRGEVYERARFFDPRPELGVWVRNQEARPQHSFWLQTATEKFYPDFVRQLINRRFLVVEYKGEDRE